MARLVKAQIGIRPRYESTVPVPWRLFPNDADAPEFGGTRWWKECGKKRSILWEQNAVALAKRLENYYHKRGHLFHAYQCPWCEWWHLGHKRCTKAKNLWKKGKL